MTAEERHHAALAEYGPLTALVGDRIYPDVIPQDKPLPAVAYMRSETEPFYGLDGTVRAARVRIATQAWAPGKSLVEAVGDAITESLAMQGCPIESRSGMYDDETGLFGIAVDCDWWV